MDKLTLDELCESGWRVEFAGHLPRVALWAGAVAPESLERLLRLQPRLLHVLGLAQQLHLGLEQAAVVPGAGATLVLVGHRGPGQHADSQSQRGSLTFWE